MKWVVNVLCRFWCLKMLLTVWKERWQRVCRLCGYPTPTVCRPFRSPAEPCHSPPWLFHHCKTLIRGCLACQCLMIDIDVTYESHRRKLSLILGTADKLVEFVVPVQVIEWMNEWRKLVTRAAVEQVESEVRAVAGRAKGGYTLRVVRDVRWVFNRRLKVSNVFDSLIAAGNSFQIVGEEKLKERLPKLVVQKGIDRRFWLAERRHRKGW